MVEQKSWKMGWGVEQEVETRRSGDVLGRQVRWKERTAGRYRAEQSRSVFR